MYGWRIERVVLSSSRARGDAREDSDYDVAVFLCYLADRFAEMKRLAEPEDIAGVALMLAARAGNYITGQTIVVDGGTTIAPS